MNIIKKIKFISLPLSLIFILSSSYGAVNTTQQNTGVGSAVTAPAGTNLGGLFVLEDWFFSPNNIGRNVGTTCSEQSGVASSWLFTRDKTVPDFTWTSETDLIKKLEARKYTTTQIIDFFKNHRAKYLSDGLTNRASDPTLSNTFAKMQEMGITLVRLPISWAIQYNKPYTLIGDKGEPVTIQAMNSSKSIELISDPFYTGTKWASIPIAQIEAILAEASKHQIKVLLEIHTYPGGAGDGTYNGIWPKAPKFWAAKDRQGHQVYEYNFQTIFGQLIQWAAELKTNNYQAFMALEGLTPMNEPAHLMGIPDVLCDKASWGITKPEEVLKTLAIGIADFRKSILPANKIKLYMNVIETMYPPVGANSKLEDMPFYKIGKWWTDPKTTALSERDKDTGWAVLDIHHYEAWNPECNTCLTQKKIEVVKDLNGNIIKDNQGNPYLKFKNINGVPDYSQPIYENDKWGEPALFYLTKNVDNSNRVTYTVNTEGLNRIKWCGNRYFTDIRKELGLSGNDLLSASEFSAGTNADTFKSCASNKAQDDKGKIMEITNSQEYRNIFLEEQIKSAKTNNITAIFWTWKIPYNDNFQKEWSLYDIMCSNNKTRAGCY